MSNTRVLRKRGRDPSDEDTRPGKLRTKEKFKPLRKVLGTVVNGDENNRNVQNIKNDGWSSCEHLKVEVKNEVKSEVSEGTVTSDVEMHEDSNVNKFEEMRKQNIQANAEFLTSIGVFEAKAHLGLVAANQKKPTRRGLKEKPKEKEVLPRRSSLRIRNLDPDGIELPLRPEVRPLYEEDLHERKSEEPITFRECLRNKDLLDRSQSFFHHKFLMSLQQLQTMKKEYSKQSSTDSDKFVKSLEKMKITPEQVAKVVPQRIFSVVVHPTETKLLACVGDKWGRVGIWDVESRFYQDGVFCYEPQARPIYEMRIHKHDHNKLYSSSYDGTLKCADLQRAIFTQVFATSEDESLRLNGFDFTSPNTAVVGINGGIMSVVDFRTEGSTAVQDYHVDRLSVKGISVHPTQPHYFLTAAKSGMVCLWDSRKLNKSSKKPTPLQELPQPKSTDAAVFSPVTGNHIVTICMDDKIRLYDSSDLTDIQLRYSISHNNHTGRWLSNFRPEWHPARDDLFVVGSMKHPRQIELYNTEGRLVKVFTDGQENLASVCSLNAFHPTKNVLVGGNSSGRVHVFKD